MKKLIVVGLMLVMLCGTTLADWAADYGAWKKLPITERGTYRAVQALSKVATTTEQRTALLDAAKTDLLSLSETNKNHTPLSCACIDIVFAEAKAQKTKAAVSNAMLDIDEIAYGAASTQPKGYAAYLNLFLGITTPGFSSDEKAVLGRTALALAGSGHYWKHYAYLVPKTSVPQEEIDIAAVEALSARPRLAFETNGRIIERVSRAFLVKVVSVIKYRELMVETYNTLYQSTDWNALTVEDKAAKQKILSKIKGSVLELLE